MSQKILVKVLKSDDQFDVICKPSENFFNFKKWCKRFVKVPVDEFSIICNGKVIEGNKRLSELGMFEVKNVYLYVISVKEEIKKLSSEEKMRKALMKKMSKHNRRSYDNEDDGNENSSTKSKSMLYSMRLIFQGGLNIMFEDSQ